ncbi:MAG TPA: LysR family transcriptional regulator [Stellaceae bacterium]|nr:LysR family transcriptional regulator [Stellaceae bacterium]
MDITTLAIFVEVMRRGSFAAVAKDRNLDPSSISRLIAGLEDELGLRLFQRSTRRLAATEAGRIYFERTEPLLEELARASQSARDVSITPSGNLRVSTTVAFGQLCIVPLIAEFRQRYPNLSLELLLTDVNLDLIGERIDVAIRLGPRLDLGYVGARLFSTRYRVCASPAYVAREGMPHSPAHLSDRDCVAFALPGFADRWLFRRASGEVTEVPIKSNLKLSSALAIRRCALDGLAPALLAHWTIDADLANGSLVDLFPHYGVTATDFDTAAWILYPSRSYLPLKVRTFVDFVREHLRRYEPG